jgi:hypothetical protein
VTREEKKKYMQDLAISVYAAHNALNKIEDIARDAGLFCSNKQMMYFVGARDKTIRVLVNGEKV